MRLLQLRRSRVSRREVCTLKMKPKYYPPTKEVQELFNLEWRRAKRICRPFLDRKKTPKLYLANNLDWGAVGMHFGRDGIYSQKLGKGQRWVRSAHVIALKADRDFDKIKHTIRHEIVHVVHQNHGPKFKALLKGLEREREIEEREYGIKIAPPPERAN